MSQRPSQSVPRSPFGNIYCEPYRGPSPKVFNLRGRLVELAETDSDRDVRLESLKAIDQIVSAEISKHGRMLGSSFFEADELYGQQQLFDRMNDLVITGETEEERALTTTIIRTLSTVPK